MTCSLRVPKLSWALLSRPLSLSTPAWALLTTRSTIGWAASAALSIDLCISSGLTDDSTLASFDDESFDASLLPEADEPPMAPDEPDEPAPEAELPVDEEPVDEEPIDEPVDEEPMAPDEPDVPDDEPMPLDEPMLPDEPAALLALLVPPLVALVAGLALDDEPPLMLPDDEPVLPEEPPAPFWLLAPDCRSLFRPDCWSLPMLLPAP